MTSPGEWQTRPIQRQQPQQWQPGPVPQQWAPQPQWQPQPQPVAPAAPAVPKTNIAAIVSVACGVLGLLLLPIVFGPAALIAGFVGEHLARKEGRKLGRLSILGILLGIAGTLVVVSRMGVL